MTPGLLIGVLAAYFGLLIMISILTGRKSTGNADFFLAGRKSNWVLVAIGMIGASLSGVTFISIPGVVGAGGVNKDFAYMQIVLGYLIGYFVIAAVLMPLYYRLNLTSIYGYLESRFGKFSYKTGAAFFLVSRLIGSSFRLYLVAIVLQRFILNAYGIPFWLTVLMTLALIWIYTYRGGIKTIVITDTFQTVAMLGSVVLTIFAIGNALDKNIFELFSTIGNTEYSRIFFFEGGWQDPNNFFKQVISGALIAIVMTGLDQDMMQKNLSCRNLREAQKNMATFSFILIFANLLFLSLGALLYIYAAETGINIPERTDQLYPTIALQHLPVFAGIVFIIGLTAAAYSSADSALTALTTSFCVDFLDIEKKDAPESAKTKTRLITHVGFTIATFLVIIIFNAINNEAVINKLFTIAGYTYGPLLGLFTFGILMKNYQVRDRWAPLVCIAAPLVSWLIDANSAALLGGFTFGFLIVALNGWLTFIGLWAVSYKETRLAEI